MNHFLCYKLGKSPDWSTMRGNSGQGKQRHLFIVSLLKKDHVIHSSYSQLTLLFGIRTFKTSDGHWSDGTVTGVWASLQRWLLKPNDTSLWCWSAGL